MSWLQPSNYNTAIERIDSSTAGTSVTGGNTIFIGQSTIPECSHSNSECCMCNRSAMIGHIKIACANHNKNHEECLMLRVQHLEEKIDALHDMIATLHEMRDEGVIRNN